MTPLAAKRYGLKFISTACTVAYIVLAGGSIFKGVSDGNYFLGALVSLFFLWFAFACWKLKLWVYKLTCVFLLTFSIFSIFYFFPPFGDEISNENKVFDAILMIGCPLVFLCVCIFYDKDFLK
jgi:hypothetical protein